MITGPLIIVLVVLTSILIAMFIVRSDKSRDGLIVLQNDAIECGKTPENVCCLSDFRCEDHETNTDCYRRASNCCEKGINPCPPPSVSQLEDQ